MSFAQSILLKAASLITGPRASSYGGMAENHKNIADLWNGFLGDRLARPLTAREVALMVALLKIARTKQGRHNPDDYVDLAGYAGVAGEIADEEMEMRPDEKSGDREPLQGTRRD